MAKDSLTSGDRTRTRLLSVSRKSAGKTLTKRILTGYGGVTDDELLEIAYDVYILKIRSKVPYPVAKGCKTLIDFIARDNPKVRDIKVEEVLDDSIVRELDESGFIKGLGLQ